MKSKKRWFSEYERSHKNPTNKLIHFFCVPIIYFSIIGLLMSIPNGLLINILPFDIPILENWAILPLAAALIFYLNLSVMLFIRMLLFSALCVFGNFYLSVQYPLLLVSLGLFVLAWVGQFIGHGIEGKKPSFLKDLQFLLIGPAWVMEKVLKS